MSERDYDPDADPAEVPADPWDGVLINDPSELIDLGNGHLLTMVVDEDGVAWPLITDVGEPMGQCHVGSALVAYEAPHEALGPLPADVRRRLDGEVRCNAWKKDGGRCQSVVDKEGARCQWHDPAVIVAKGYAAPRLNLLINIRNAQETTEARHSVQQEFLDLSDAWHEVDAEACDTFWERYSKRIRA